MLAAPVPDCRNRGGNFCVGTGACSAGSPAQNTYRVVCILSSAVYSTPQAIVRGVLFDPLEVQPDQCGFLRVNNLHQNCTEALTDDEQNGIMRVCDAVRRLYTIHNESREKENG